MVIGPQEGGLAHVHTHSVSVTLECSFLSSSEELGSLQSLPSTCLLRAVAMIICPLRTMHPQPQSVDREVPEMLEKLALGGRGGGGGRGGCMVQTRETT